MTMPMTLDELRQIATEDRNLALALLFRYAECARAALRALDVIARESGPFDEAIDFRAIVDVAANDMCGDIKAGAWPTL